MRLFITLLLMFWIMPLRAEDDRFYPLLARR